MLRALMKSARLRLINLTAIKALTAHRLSKRRSDLLCHHLDQTKQPGGWIVTSFYWYVPWGA